MNTKRLLSLTVILGLVVAMGTAQAVKVAVLINIGSNNTLNLIEPIEPLDFDVPEGTTLDWLRKKVATTLKMGKSKDALKSLIFLNEANAPLEDGATKVASVTMDPLHIFIDMSLPELIKIKELKLTPTKRAELKISDTLLTAKRPLALTLKPGEAEKAKEEAVTSPTSAEAEPLSPGQIKVPIAIHILKDSQSFALSDPVKKVTIAIVENASLAAWQTTLAAALNDKLKNKQVEPTMLQFLNSKNQPAKNPSKVLAKNPTNEIHVVLDEKNPYAAATILEIKDVSKFINAPPASTTPPVQPKTGNLPLPPTITIRIINKDKSIDVPLPESMSKAAGLDTVANLPHNAGQLVHHLAMEDELLKEFVNFPTTLPKPTNLKLIDTAEMDTLINKKVTIELTLLPQVDPRRLTEVLHLTSEELRTLGLLDSSTDEKHSQEQKAPGASEKSQSTTPPASAAQDVDTIIREAGTVFEPIVRRPKMAATEQEIRKCIEALQQMLSALQTKVTGKSLTRVNDFMCFAKIAWSHKFLTTATQKLTPVLSDTTEKLSDIEKRNSALAKEVLNNAAATTLTQWKTELLLDIERTPDIPANNTPDIKFFTEYLKNNLKLSPTFVDEGNFKTPEIIKAKLSNAVNTGAPNLFAPTQETTSGGGSGGGAPHGSGSSNVDSKPSESWNKTGVAVSFAGVAALAALLYKYRKAIRARFSGKRTDIPAGVAELTTVEEQRKENKLTGDEYEKKKKDLLMNYSEEDGQMIEDAVDKKMVSTTQAST